MLKLPKGLKKKKKSKKSKKDQELFTEEELEQYRREHQHHSIAGSSTVPSDSEDHSGGGDKSENDAEWSKFAALTSGIDSVLKKTQGDLDRIKSTSFFQKVPTQVEQKIREREERDRIEQEKLSREREEENTVQERSTAEKLINAVVELTESETNSEAEESDIFDTGYIDAIASGELPIAYVPESPVIESYEGEDPFDTSYADKVIKGPEVSKRGKKLVSIGSAVQVLTGRVECASSFTKGNRQRRGQPDLLLESFDEGEQQQQGAHSSEETLPIQFTTVSKGSEVKTLSLLDESDNFPDNISVELSAVLLQKQYQEVTKQATEQETCASTKNLSTLDLDEFDELKNRNSFVNGTYDLKLQNEEVDGEKSSNLSSALNQLGYDLPTSSSHVSEVGDPFDTGFVEKVLPATAVEDDDFDPRAEYSTEYNNLGFDLQSREEANDSTIKKLDLFSAIEEFPPFDSTRTFVTDQHLLSGNSPKPADISQHTALDCVKSSVQGKEIEPHILFADPFDTSNVELVAAPSQTELKYLEEELLANRQCIGNSLSDPNFDPRADGACDTRTTIHLQEEHHCPEDNFQSIALRKSSLSLQISGAGLSEAVATNRSKSVVFAVPTPDLLKIDVENSVTKKPLTPYYNRETPTTDSYVDPFDTSFVTSTEPTQLELHLLDQELNSVTLRQSISDPDFDPRADTSTIAPRNEAPETQQSDLLSVSENNQDHHKVLTPANLGEKADNSDPFDTSIAVNLLPGRTELKLLEDELIPPLFKNDCLISDILSDGAHEDNSVFVKVLTPQASNTSLDWVSQSVELDPFDTSFVSNLGPGRAEIKVLESELIDQ